MNTHARLQDTGRFGDQGASFVSLALEVCKVSLCMQELAVCNPIVSHRRCPIGFPPWYSVRRRCGHRMWPRASLKKPLLKATHRAYVCHTNARMAKY